MKMEFQKGYWWEGFSFKVEILLNNSKIYPVNINIAKIGKKFLQSK